MKNSSHQKTIEKLIREEFKSKKRKLIDSAILPEVIVISTFPPRECGIATYTQDLVKSLEKQFDKSFNLKICALDNENQKHSYSDTIDYFLDANLSDSLLDLSKEINENDAIQMVLIQHEFGLFRNNEAKLLQFLNQLEKSVLVVFHTVLPRPDKNLQQNVQEIIKVTDGIIVMTKASSTILENDYQINKNKISVIPHGTHLVEHTSKNKLKNKYNLLNRKVLSTFGLLSAGKSIETTLEALPLVIKENPEIVFLIIGKTHPTVVKQEGERYREMLEAKIEILNLSKNVRFVNEYLPLEELLEYLQLTDIYLFTSKDPHQAVSGTFSYALSCGCPIISTPIPHACEVLNNGNGIIIDFENPIQLAHEVNKLLSDPTLMKNISLNGLHKMAPTAWENSAIAHAKLFEKNIAKKGIKLNYKIPSINLKHIQKLTTSVGIIQFSIINQPDIDSGYTLDDNARALIAICQHYQLTGDKSDLKYIKKYLKFLKFCFHPDNHFLNYVNENLLFTEQNYQTNLEDSNGRAIWALGFLISNNAILPPKLGLKANKIIDKFLINSNSIHSTRAMAFIIKGLYYRNLANPSVENKLYIKVLADKMIQMYRHHTDENWQWFEGYLTYANSILSEAILCAWIVTRDTTYKEIAQESFGFLLSKIMNGNKINVISNKGWLHKGQELNLEMKGGEQPIDVAYTIITLGKFYDEFQNEDYLDKMKTAFSWFLGNNHLNQIIYNPCTGGCYDGLESTYVNLNQGAESTVSYLMARLTIEKYANKIRNQSSKYLNLIRLNSLAKF
jgi:glycosyltransferase involved in cell wall biosynthesis